MSSFQRDKPSLADTSLLLKPKAALSEEVQYVQTVETKFAAKDHAGLLCVVVRPFVGIDSTSSLILLSPLMPRPIPSVYRFNNFWWPSDCCKIVTKEEAEQLLIAHELQQ